MHTNTPVIPVIRGKQNATANTPKPARWSTATHTNSAPRTTDVPENAQAPRDAFFLVTHEKIANAAGRHAAITSARSNPSSPTVSVASRGISGLDHMAYRKSKAGV